MKHRLRTAGLTDLIDRPRVEPKLARLMLAASVVAILFCGLFPFDLDFREASQRISERFDTTVTQFYTAADTIENVVFFAPLGFAVGAVVSRRKKPSLALGGVALGAGLILSLVVELLQCLLVERDPSLPDVVNNTIGSCIGFAIFRAVGGKVMQYVAQTIERMQKRSGVTTLAILSCVMVLVVCAAPLLLGMDAGRLSGWNPSYPLAIGNEIGGRRQWEGRIWDIAIASRAATPSQVAELLAGRDATQVLGDTLVAAYDVRGEPPFLDRARNLAPIRVASNLPVQSTQPHRAITPATSLRQTTTSFAATSATKPATLPAAPPDALPWAQSEETWLRTTEPVDALVDAVTRDSQFTVKFTAASDRVEQWLDARLLTISMGTLDRNLSFAQDLSRLTVRVRTGATGNNGMAPRFVVRDVFADSLPHTIVATYANSTLHVYVDRPTWAESARITPEATVIWSMYPRSDWSYQLVGEGGDGAVIAGIIYRALAFLVLGTLITATVNQFRRPYRERLIIVIVALLAIMVLFEGLISTVAHQSMHASYIIASIIFGVIGVVIVGVREALPWSE